VRHLGRVLTVSTVLVVSLCECVSLSVFSLCVSIRSCLSSHLSSIGLYPVSIAPQCRATHSARRSRRPPRLPCPVRRALAGGPRRVPVRCTPSGRLSGSRCRAACGRRAGCVPFPGARLFGCVVRLRTRVT